MVIQANLSKAYSATAGLALKPNIASTSDHHRCTWQCEKRM